MSAAKEFFQLDENPFVSERQDALENSFKAATKFRLSLDVE